MEAGAGADTRARRRQIGGGPLAAVILGAALAGIGIGVGWHLLLAGSTPTKPTAAAKLDGQATWAAGAQPAPAIINLKDQGGHPFSLTSLRGRPVAMVFFDSYCRQECPLAGRAVAAADLLLPRAQRPVLVVVSINPLDTPASTRAAARAWGLAGAAPWHWLRGTHAQLARVWKAYHIFVQPMKGDISHTEALYLIDRRGDERSGYLYPYIPGFVAHDMKLLASERASHLAGRA